MSKDYVIVVDSTTDLPAELAEQLGLVVIPYIFTMDGKDYLNYLDYRELSAKDFYSNLRGGKLSTTAQVTAHRYMEAWEPFLKEGKDVLYMCLSSALSKSYDQSVMAAKEAMETYPDCKVIAIDSKSASLGQGLLAYYAAKARDEGKTLEENAAYLEDIIPRLHHWVIADDLHHMRRGGRVSGASAFVGTMLNIKPVLTLLDDGRIVPIAKLRGWGKVRDYIKNCYKEYNLSPKDQPIFIAHGDDIDKANQFAEDIKAELGNNEIIMNYVGPVIGTHAGPGTVAIMFIGSERAKA